MRGLACLTIALALIGTVACVTDEVVDVTELTTELHTEFAKLGEGIESGAAETGHKEDVVKFMDTMGTLLNRLGTDGKAAHVKAKLYRSFVGALRAKGGRRRKHSRGGKGRARRARMKKMSQALKR
jgi:hypothetical protein